MWHDVRAETIVQARRPAHWLLLVTALSLTLTFGYLVPYTADDAASSRGRPLEAMLPEDLAGAAIAGLPVFVGALALIFGVLVVGSDFAWDTWKTALVLQRSRTAVLAGKGVVLAGGALLLVLSLLAVSAGASWLVATAENAPATPPGWQEIVRDAGAGWLIASTWSMFGAALSVLLRAVALPVGIGLVWMLAVQNLISELAAPLVDWVDAAQRWLPGPAAGSLVATLTGRTDTPGVTRLTDAGTATAVLLAYLVGFAVLCVVTMRSRDLS